MDLNVYLIGGAVLLIAIIVINHQKQKSKMQAMLQQSGGTQLMFLMKAVEKKNKAISDILFEGDDRSAVQVGGPKGALVKELEHLEGLYATKKIPLRTYDEKLFDLLERAKKLPVNA